MIGNPFNPNDALTHRREQVARREDRGFCREIHEPIVTQLENGESRVTGTRVTIFYFPPMADGFPHAERPSKQLAQLITPSWRWHQPYWWNLIGEPVTNTPGRLSESGGHNQWLYPNQQLRLIVDRDVAVTIPQTAAQRTMEVPFPSRIRRDVPLTPPLVTAHLPDVFIHRVQNEAQVPQSADDDFSFLAQTIVEERVLQRSGQQAINLKVYQETDQTGGMLLGFTEIVPAIHVTRAMPDGPNYTYSIPSRELFLAMIRLNYYNAHVEGAYFYRIAETAGSDGKFRVDIVTSRNIRITLYHPNILAGTSIDAVLPDFERFDIRFAPRVARNTVPRPGSRQRVTTTNWMELVANDLLERPFPLGGEGARLAIDIAVGFVPILGDIIEIGEFVLALTTGRDRWGNPVETGDLLLMGLGALPILPASLMRGVPRLAERESDFRRLLGIDSQQSGDVSELLRQRHSDLPELLRQHRHGLIEALRHVSANDLQSLGRALANERKVEKLFGLTGIRDNVLATLLGL